MNPEFFIIGYLFLLWGLPLLCVCVLCIFHVSSDRSGVVSYWFFSVSICMHCILYLVFCMHCISYLEFVCIVSCICMRCILYLVFCICMRCMRCILYLVFVCIVSFLFPQIVVPSLHVPPLPVATHLSLSDIQNISNHCDYSTENQCEHR